MGNDCFSGIALCWLSWGLLNQNRGTAMTKYQDFRHCWPACWALRCAACDGRCHRQYRCLFQIYPARHHCLAVRLAISRAPSGCCHSSGWAGLCPRKGFYAPATGSRPLAYGYNALNAGVADRSACRIQPKATSTPGYNGWVGGLHRRLQPYYVYSPGFHSTAAETKLGVSYGPVSVTAQTLLKDVTFGNKGDTTITLPPTPNRCRRTLLQPLRSVGTADKQGRDIDSGNLVHRLPARRLIARSAGHSAISRLVSPTRSAKPARPGLQYIPGGKNRFDLETGQPAGDRY